ncbi:hypothetical protein FPF71_04460 [Algibacter amylolyticus]|uniref:YdhG-like domain-containing protein n=1 Tax=Algibacter amylolyticus TaxID=1608400 RepID=A0A5M7BLP8_9FLAO|nr:DUF1801 domain-containing protein [Algibacter amylolyticus]KAA5828091.1 hypothetical protein F2B50_04460 [Algibacter amylolyticus]MBB5267339.1 uncharacterized protein YdeI (YjbR/CyaY-like superfamily) [Algibacter amylolyticus]TSJ82336.1 hypothetical protein FPF71_04460 [Algibacter amylolyticus]
MNPKVDKYLEHVKTWKSELELLRTIIISCGLSEDFKWRNPCYSFKGKNIVIIGGFKAFCSLSFFKGAILKDTEGILKKPGPNSRSTKLIPFTSTKEVIALEAILKRYIYEAIAIEEAGIQVKIDKTDELNYPEELKSEFLEKPEFETAFKELTKGRQRGYILHFTSAKQSKTRTSRILKCEARILKGFGFNDCTCGLSKRKPNCDGSHKQLQNK